MAGGSIITMTTKDIPDIPRLKDAIQKAIELEHATIPVYLTALFSIKPGQNKEVAEIIHSVVLEEMLHMALACNLLNSIGGSPEINTSNFVPEFPTKLPGGVRPELTVSLRKCSIDQIRDVFMQIEEPDKTKGSPTPNPNTIGDFYQKIEKAFIRLDDNGRGNIFIGDESKQLTNWQYAGKLIAVHDLRSARDAINEIVEQGEGASEFNPDDGYGELSHYYKFAEIVNGHKIVVANGNYTYSGDKIPFNPAEVWNMIDNPDTEKLPENSPARALSKQFNLTYGRVLNSLHEVFNGHPEKFEDARALMSSVTIAARQLMQTSIPPENEFMAGTAFQFPKSQ